MSSRIFRVLGGLWRLEVGEALRVVLTAALLILVGGVFGSGCSESTEATGPQAEEVPGAKTYQHFCFSCHEVGISGAPRIGDAGAWAEIMEKGEEAVLKGVVDGIPPAMPKRGMCLQCSDQELQDAIDYMVSRSQ